MLILIDPTTAPKGVKYDRTDVFLMDPSASVGTTAPLAAGLALLLLPCSSHRSMQGCPGAQEGESKGITANNVDLLIVCTALDLSMCTSAVQQHVGAGLLEH